MDDYALVLNAGSSSLKFCVYQRPASEAWRLEARGQIEGIGTSPRFSAKNGAGDRLADEALDKAVVRDGRTALDALAVLAPLDVRRCSRARRRPPRGTRRTPFYRSHNHHAPGARRAQDTRAARAAPSAAQPCGDRCGRRAAAGCASSGLLRHELSPRPAGRRRSSFPCRATSAPEACSVMAFTAFRTSTSRRCFPTWRPTSRTDASSSRTWEAAPVSARCGIARASTARWGSRRSTGSAWARVPGRSIPGWSSTCFRTSGSRPRRWRPSSTRSRVCSASPGPATTCATFWPAANRRAQLAVDYFVYRATKEIGALAAVLGGIDGLVFTAGIGENSAEIRSRICAASAWLGIDMDPDGEPRRALPDLPIGKPRLGLGDPDKRGADHRASHRRAAGQLDVRSTTMRRGTAHRSRESLGDRGGRLAGGLSCRLSDRAEAGSAQPSGIREQLRPDGATVPNAARKPLIRDASRSSRADPRGTHSASESAEPAV